MMKLLAFLKKHDAFTSFLVITGIAYIIRFLNLETSIDTNIPLTLRFSLYNTLVQIMSTLLGIIMAGLAILLTMDKSPAVQLITKSKFYPEIFSTYISCMYRLAFSTLVILLVMLLEGLSFMHFWNFFIVVWCVYITSYKMWKCIWILKNMVYLQMLK